MQAIFSLNGVFTQLISFLSMRQFGVNALDILLVLVVLFYCYEGYLLGFIKATLDFLSFVVSFLLGLVFYAPVSGWLVSLFSLPQGFANAIGFFLIALISEVGIMLALSRLDHLAPPQRTSSKYKDIFKKVNHPLGILPDWLQRISSSRFY